MKLTNTLFVVAAATALFATLFAFKDIDGNTGALGRAPGNVPPVSHGDDDWGVPQQFHLVIVNGLPTIFVVKEDGSTQEAASGQTVTTSGIPQAGPVMQMTTESACGGSVTTSSWAWAFNGELVSGVMALHQSGVEASCTQAASTPGFEPPGTGGMVAVTYITTAWVDADGNEHSISTRQKTGESIGAALERHHAWLTAAQAIWPPVVQDPPGETGMLDRAPLPPLLFLERCTTLRRAA